MLAVLATLSLGAALAGGPAAEACRLLPEADVARVQETTLKGAKASRQESAGVAISSCFYSADPFSKSVSLEVVTAPAPDAVLARWKKMFHEKREEEDEDRRPGAEKQPVEVPVAGLGEEAFWVPSPATGALHVLAGGVSFRLSLGGAGTADAKLAKCRLLAQKLLANLKTPPS
jgi:hypothetical protein